MIIRSFILNSGFALAVLTTLARAQVHEHLNAGAESPTPGSKLILDGAGPFLAESGFVWPLTHYSNPNGYFPGQYATNYLTFTSLAATLFYGGPDGPHASIGADLWLQIVSVDGPSGRTFGYWEAEDYFFFTTPTESFATGSIEAAPGAGLYEFWLTEAVPDDPFGHVHDRAYSASGPGVYTIGFRLTDAEGIHSDGDVFYLRFGSAGATAFGSWMAVYGLAQNGLLDDPDQDGMCNMEEYVWNCRPDLPDAGQRPVSTTMIPGSPGTYRIRYRPVEARLLDVAVVLETATNLGNPTVWTPVNPSQIVRLADGTYQADLPATGPKLFTRFRMIEHLP
jgi:hypothetical protein